MFEKQCGIIVVIINKIRREGCSSFLCLHFEFLGSARVVVEPIEKSHRNRSGQQRNCILLAANCPPADLQGMNSTTCCALYVMVDSRPCPFQSSDGIAG